MRQLASTSGLESDKVVYVQWGIHLQCVYTYYFFNMKMFHLELRAFQQIHAVYDGTHTDVD